MIRRRIGFFLAGGVVALAAGGGAVAYTAAGASAAARDPSDGIPLVAGGAREGDHGRRDGQRADLYRNRPAHATRRTSRSGSGRRSSRATSRSGSGSRPGTLLFRLDATDYRLAVKAAEADLIAAEAEVVQSVAEHDRQLRSFRSGVGSSTDLDKARSAQDVAVGRRDRAKEALDPRPKPALILRPDRRRGRGHHRTSGRGRAGGGRGPGRRPARPRRGAGGDRESPREPGDRREDGPRRGHALVRSGRVVPGRHSANSPPSPTRSRAPIRPGSRSRTRDRKWHWA